MTPDGRSLWRLLHHPVVVPLACIGVAVVFGGLGVVALVVIYAIVISK